MQATQLWTNWQALLEPFADAFTYPGFQRFQEWITGLVLNVEEHTITQSLIGLGRPRDWKALEAFAEYGAWDQPALERAAAHLIDQAPGRLWGPKLPPPRQGGRWPGGWQEGRAWIYGRWRK